MQAQEQIEFSRLEDTKLFDLCEKGDEPAWAYLFSYVHGITRWKRWNLGSNAEDIVQNVMLTLIEKGIRMVKDHKNFRAFVKRVTINKILDSYKTPETTALPDDDRHDYALKTIGKENPEHNASEKKMIHEEIVTLSLKIIRELPQYCQELMKTYLDYQLGLVSSYQEIADTLKLSINTVSVQIKRCLDQLRRHRNFGLLEEFRE